MRLTYFVGRASLENTGGRGLSAGVVGPLRVAAGWEEAATQHPGQGAQALGGWLERKHRDLQIAVR